MSVSRSMGASGMGFVVAAGADLTRPFGAGTLLNSAQAPYTGNARVCPNGRPFGRNTRERPLSAENILFRTQRLQRRAEVVIARLGLRERWARVGDVFLVGSARFGLMTTPNLDFEVYAERPDAAAGAAVMRAIAAEPGVTHLVHHDFMTNPDDPGLYWRLDYRDECGAAWDCDIWLVPFSHPHAGMAEAFAQAMAGVLTDGSRAAILRLKEALAVRAAAGGTQRPRGIDIYRAVLEGGVVDVAGFDAWRAATPRPELETWRP